MRELVVSFTLVTLTLLAGCGHRRHHASSVCPDGSAWDGASCAPNAAQAQAQAQVEAEAPPPAAEQTWTCPGGSVAQGDGCACPEGTAWIDERCQAAQIVQAPVAPSRPQRKRSAWIPAPPQAPAPPALPSVNIDVNGAARALQPSPREPAQQQAPPPQAAPSRPTSSPNTQVTYAACTGGMVRNGTACQCPQGTTWENGQCLVACHPTQRRDGTQCVCPKDTRWNGSQCELWQECRGGQVHLGASCICPAQTSWDGQRCAPKRR